MKFYCRHWYTIGGIIALFTLALLILRWNSFDQVMRLLLLSFIAILTHQFEEYGFPGGEPYIMNKLIQGSDTPDRYPLNQFSGMFTNVVGALFYLLPIIFPHVIWLALGPMLMGMGQIAVHFFLPVKKFHMFYTPGLGAVLLLHWPIGIYYIYYMTAHGGIGLANWLGGIGFLIFIMAFIAIATYKILPDYNTKWIYPPEEMNRFQSHI